MNLTFFNRPLALDRAHLFVIGVLALFFGILPLAYVSGTVLLITGQLGELRLTDLGWVRFAASLVALGALLGMVLNLVAVPRERRSGQPDRHVVTCVISLLVLGVASVLCAACMISLLR